MVSRQQTFIAPPKIPINEYDTTPNPGIEGVLVWSSSAKMLLVWDGERWVSAAGPGDSLTLAPANTTDSTPVAATGNTGDLNVAARQNHAHGHGNQAGGALHDEATEATAGFLGKDDKKKLNAYPATPTPNTPLSTNAPPAVIVGGASSAGTGSAASKDGHTHGLPLATASNDGAMSMADFNKCTNLAENANTAYAASAHTHADATTSTSGFFTAAEKIKLSGIADGATNTAPPPALSTNAPPAIVVGGASSAGSGTAASNDGHTHSLPLATGSTAGAMSSADFTKLANIQTPPSAPGAAPPLIASATSSLGTVGTYATADHNHGHGNVAATTTLDQYHGDATATEYGFMTPAQVTKLNGIATNATAVSFPTATTAGTLAMGAPQAAQGGGAGTGARSDHQHPAATASNAGLMTAAYASKVDGIQAGATNTAAPPAVTGSAPPDIAAAGAIGNSGTYANYNHTHGHGNQAGSASANVYHAAASGSVYGLMSPTDFNKCANLAANANGTYQNAGVYATRGANGVLAASDFVRFDDATYPRRYRAKAYAPGNQTIPANTWTAITLNSISVDTSGNFYNNAFNAPVAGYYWVWAVMRTYAATAGGWSSLAIATNSNYDWMEGGRYDSTSSTHCAMGGVYYLAVGHTCNINAFHQSWGDCRIATAFLSVALHSLA